LSLIILSSDIGPQITDAGAAALATAVRVNRSLNELFLIGNPITAGVAKAFVDAFEVNPTLTYYVGPGGPLKKRPTTLTTPIAPKKKFVAAEHVEVIQDDGPTPIPSPTGTVRGQRK